MIKFKDILKESPKERFDLKREFDILNRKLFKNQLTPVKLGWSRSKNVLGAVRVLTQRSDYGKKDYYKIKDLKITTVYEFTREQFLATLAHEMIHVYMLQNDMVHSGADYHGYEFEHLVKEKEKILGFKINRTESPSELELTNTKPLSKEVLVAILHMNNNKDFILIFKSLNDREFQILHKRIKIGYRNLQSVEYYESRSPELRKYTLKRKMTRNLSSEYADRSIIDSIKKYGKNIKAPDITRTLKGSMLENIIAYILYRTDGKQLIIPTTQYNTHLISKSVESLKRENDVENVEVYKSNHPIMKSFGKINKTVFAPHVNADYIDGQDLNLIKKYGEKVRVK